MEWKRVLAGIVALAMIATVFSALGGLPVVRAQEGDAGGIIQNWAPTIATALTLDSPSHTQLDNGDGNGFLPALFPQGADELLISMELFDNNSEDAAAGADWLGYETGYKNVAPSISVIQIYNDTDGNGAIDWGVNDQLDRQLTIDTTTGYSWDTNLQDPTTWNHGRDGDTFVFYGGNSHTDGYYWLSDGALAGTGEGDVGVNTGDTGTGDTLYYTVSGQLHGVQVIVYDDDGASVTAQALFRCYRLWKVLGVFDESAVLQSAGPFHWDFNTTNPGSAYAYSADPTMTTRWSLVVQWLAPANMADLTVTFDTEFEPSDTNLQTDYGIPTTLLDMRVADDETWQPTGEVSAADVTTNGNYPFDTTPAGDTNSVDSSTITINLDGLGYSQYEVIWMIYTIGDDPDFAADDGNTLPAILPDDDYTSAVTLGAA